MDLDEHTARAIRLFSRSKVTADAETRREDLDVDAEMRREAANRLNLAADVEGMPDRPRIAALSLAFWLATTSTPEATEAARVLLGRSDVLDDGAS